MKKLILLILGVVFVSGCSAEYSIEITGKDIIEEMILVYDEEKVYETGSEKSIEEFFDEFVNNYQPVYYDSLHDPTENEKVTGVKYYDVEYIDNSINKVKFHAETEIYNLHKSNIIYTCVSDFRVKKDNNYYSLSADNGLSCLKDLSLEEVQISIKTNNELIFSNADYYNEETEQHIWYYDKENYNTKFLSFIYSDETEREEEEQEDDGYINETPEKTDDDNNVEEIKASRNTILIALGVITFFVISLIVIIIIKKKRL